MPTKSFRYYDLSCFKHARLHQRVNLGKIDFHLRSLGILYHFRFTFPFQLMLDFCRWFGGSNLQEQAVAHELAQFLPSSHQWKANMDHTMINHLHHLTSVS